MRRKHVSGWQKAVLRSNYRKAKAAYKAAGAKLGRAEGIPQHGSRRSKRTKARRSR